MSTLSTASPPRRSGSVLGRSGESVRRLARRLSSSVLRKESGASRPGSVASARRGEEKRLGFMRRKGSGGEVGVVEEVESVESCEGVKMPAARIVGRKRAYDIAPLVEGRRVGFSWEPLACAR